MGNVLLWSIGIIVFLAIVSISIGAHEAGHMIVAKKLGLKVPKYFVGFGKTIWSTKRGEGDDETEYGVKMLPLGGFVQIYDPSVTDKDDPERDLLSQVTPWKRISVFAAGPAVNIVIGFVMFVMLLMIVPTVSPTNKVEAVDACSSGVHCGGAIAGLMPSDVITEVDGKPVTTDLSHYLAGKKEVSLTVDRQGEIITIPTVTLSPESRLGIRVELEERARSLPESVSTFNNFLAMNLKAIANIPAKVVPTFKVVMGEERDEESLTSIVAAGQLYGSTAAEQSTSFKEKVTQFVLYTALINLSLGLINLVPIGILDGGRILIAGIDSGRMRFAQVYKKWNYTPLGVKWVNALLSVTSVALFGFILLLVVADIVNPMPM